MTKLDRKNAPVPTGEIGFEIPKIKLITTDKGSEVYFVPKEKLPIVQLVLSFNCGSKMDPADKKGLAFLTSLMIDEGAGEYDALQLNNEFEKLGSILSISANHDTFTISLLSLKENFERSIELIGKIVNEPHFEQKDFDREKKKILDRILQLKDEPAYIANSVFEKIIFGDSGYAFPEIGFESTVKQIDLNNIKEYHSDVLLNSKLNFTVVGNINKQEIINLIDKHFNLNNDSQKKSTDSFPLRTNTKIYFVHKDESAQSEIRIGHIGKDRKAEDYYPAKIMNAILGGQFSSRINLNLREDKGFTYGASSSLNYVKHAGYFEVSTAVDIDNTGAAVSEILKELNGIKKEITQKEIDFSKSYLIKQFPSRFETYTQIARNISPLLLHKLPLDYYEHYTERINNITPEQIQAAALNNIFDDQLVILTVGDKTKLLPKLQNLFNQEIIELDIYGVRV